MGQNILYPTVAQPMTFLILLERYWWSSRSYWLMFSNQVSGVECIVCFTLANIFIAIGFFYRECKACEEDRGLRVTWALWWVSIAFKRAGSWKLRGFLCFHARKNIKVNVKAGAKVFLEIRSSRKQAHLCWVQKFPWLKSLLQLNLVCCETETVQR